MVVVVVMDVDDGYSDCAVVDHVDVDECEMVNVEGDEERVVNMGR